jgi:hypothetical protein
VKATNLRDLPSRFVASASPRASKRILAVNVQGMTGKKRDFTSLPYSKIQAFSVETAGTFDLDAELELWFSGLGKVHLEFRGAFDITYLSRLIASKVL